MSNRKPLNDTAGYVCSRKCPDGGYVMVVDRERGGAWIDGETRWVVCKYNSSLENEGIMDLQTKSDAIGFMKETADGLSDWYEPAIA